jgi:hypothetical protein
VLIAVMAVNNLLGELLRDASREFWRDLINNELSPR